MYIYNVIEGLVNFYSAAPLNKFCLLLGFWLFWPGLMFIVGAIGESRLVPIWEHQSRAFFPGDLSLGVMLVALLDLHASKLESADWWGYSVFWLLIVVLAMASVASRIHLTDASHYSFRSRCSPTKVVHDIIGYWFIPTLLIFLGLPKLFEFVVQGYTANECISWAAFVAALAFYFMCIRWDSVLGHTEEDVTARHPPDWQPIWQRYFTK